MTDKSLLMKKLLLLLAVFGAFSNNAFSQADCLTVAHFCTSSGTTFPVSTSTTVAVGLDYGCLGTQPNPAWYYMNITTSGDITTSVSENPIHTWQYIVAHPATLTVFNVNGCNNVITYMIIIDDIITAYIPNTFTPNNDGINDVFNMYSNGISSENFEMLIFDRWGNKIFTSRSLSEGWNGGVNNRGEVVQEDEYVYKFNYQDFKEKT